MPLLRIREHDSSIAEILRWLEEAGGSMDLGDFKFKHMERFKCAPYVYDDEEVKEMPSLKGLRVENNRVHMPEERQKLPRERRKRRRLAKGA